MHKNMLSDTTNYYTKPTYAVHSPSHYTIMRPPPSPEHCCCLLLLLLLLIDLLPPWPADHQLLLEWMVVWHGCWVDKQDLLLITQ